MDASFGHLSLYSVKRSVKILRRTLSISAQCSHKRFSILFLCLPIGTNLVPFC